MAKVEKQASVTKTYIQLTDPWDGIEGDDPDDPSIIHRGDFWIVRDHDAPDGLVKWKDYAWDGTPNPGKTWGHLKNDIKDWGGVLGNCKMYCWKGNSEGVGEWVLVYDDSKLAVAFTQITQTEEMIKLEAYRANAAEGELHAELNIQADRIQSEVSRATEAEGALSSQISQTATEIMTEVIRVRDTSARTFIQDTDPALVESNHVKDGDYWIKNADASDGDWREAKKSKWGDVKTKTWGDIFVGTTEMYVRKNGEWVNVYDAEDFEIAYSRINQTADMIRMEVTRATSAEGVLTSQIKQTAESIELEVTRASSAEGVLSSRIVQTAESITAEVSRAKSAEGTLNSKTKYLQTSGLIELSAFTEGTNGTAMGVLTKAGISVDASGHIKIESTDIGQQTSGIYITPNSITAGSTGNIDFSAAKTFSIRAGLIKLEALESDDISAFNFDSLGEINTTGVYITPNLIKVSSTGDVDFSLAKTFKVQAGAIKLEALESDKLSDFDFDRLGAPQTTGVEITPTLIKIGATGSIDLSAANSISIKADAINLSTFTFDELKGKTTTGVEITPSLIKVGSAGSIDFSAANSISFNSQAISLTALASTNLSDYTLDHIGDQTGVYITPTQLKLAATGNILISSGNFTLDASGNGTIGGWSFTNVQLNSGSGTGYVALNSDNTWNASATNPVTGNAGDWSQPYAIWFGNSTPGSAPFRVRRDGVAYITKLMIVDNEGQNPREFNPYSSLWKIGSTYKTVKSVTVTGNYCSAMAFSDGTTVNFKHAVTAVLAGSWNGSVFTVDASNDPNVLPITETFTFPTGTGDPGAVGGSTVVNTFDETTHEAYAQVKSTRVPMGVLRTIHIDASSVYTQGYNRGKAEAVTAVLAGSWNGSVFTVSAINDPNVLPITETISFSTGTGDPGSVGGSTVVDTFDATTHKAYAQVKSTRVPYSVLQTIHIDASTVYTQAWDAVAFSNETLWINGEKTYTLSNGKQKTARIPDPVDWAATYVPTGKMSVSAIVGGRAISSGEMNDPGYSYGYNAGKSDVVVSATVSAATVLSVDNSSVTVKTYKDGVEYSSATQIINTNSPWTNGYVTANNEYTNLGNPGQLYVKKSDGTYTPWQYPMTIYTK